MRACFLPFRPRSILSSRDKGVGGKGVWGLAFGLALTMILSQYTIKGSIMHPRSNPTYYKDLLRELEEGPKRSWFDRLMLKIGGLVRF